VARVLERHQLIGARLLVAVSGGVDSTVLLDALQALAGRCDLTLAVGHVNHGLRGGESDEDQAAVAVQAARLGVPFAVETVDPEALRRAVPSRRRPTLQEAARVVRYRALRSMAAAVGATDLAMAHQADDQAETLLLRILRGCGPDALAGMSVRSREAGLVRPLLGVSREEIMAYARERGLRWREDPSNRSLRYARNRLRQRWLPGLSREFNPQLLRKLGQLAEAMHRDAEWMAELVDAEAGRRLCVRHGGIEIRREGWGELPEALSWRLLRRALIDLGGGRELSRRHLERMHRFLCSGRSGSVIELPEGLRLRCAPDRAYLERGPSRGVGAGAAC
jgi:tRNA(Ile)-lysidine synthase